MSSRVEMASFPRIVIIGLLDLNAFNYDKVVSCLSIFHMDNLSNCANIFQFLVKLEYSKDGSVFEEPD